MVHLVCLFRRFRLLIIAVELPPLLIDLYSSVVKGGYLRFLGWELREHDLFELCVLTEFGPCLHGWAHLDLVIQARHSGQGRSNIDGEATFEGHVILVAGQAWIKIIEPILCPLLLGLNHAALVTVLYDLRVHYLPQLFLFLLD